MIASIAAGMAARVVCRIRRPETYKLLIRGAHGININTYLYCVMAHVTARTLAIAALRFRALGDETRLRLLEILTSGERSVGDLMEVTGLGQSLVSHHLRSLRQGGLVTTRRDGRWIFYATSPTVIAGTCRVLNDLVPVRGSPVPSDAPHIEQHRT